MQFLHFVAFSNSSECSQITKVSSIKIFLNAPMKPVKVSEAVQKTLQQPAENSQPVVRKEDLHLYS